MSRRIGVRAIWLVPHIDRSENPAVDYGADLAVSYELGRQLSSEAQSTWQAAVGPYLPAVGTVFDVGAGTGRLLD